MTTWRVNGGAAQRCLAALVCAVLLWISVGVSVNLILADTSWSASRLWPWGAEIRTAEAERLLGLKASRAELDRAAALAAAALARAPASAVAARTLGAADVLRRDPSQAERLYAVAERLSRRDLSTEAFWIQREVIRGDVDGALVHYDRALRTNEEAWPLLLDKLTSASAEPAIATGVAGLLDRAPPWRLKYVQQLIGKTMPAPLFVTLIAHARLDANDALERDALVGAMQRLADEGQPGLAYRLLPRAFRSAAVPADGGFEQAEGAGLEPFAWHLRSDSDLSATRVGSSEGDGATVLRLQANAERGGEVASQMLILGPGRYRLSALVGAVLAGPGRAPTVSVTCLRSNQVRLALPLTPSGSAGHVAGSFGIPAGCIGQRLALSTPPAVSTDTWVDDLVIRPDPA